MRTTESTPLASKSRMPYARNNAEVLILSLQLSFLH
jgi:hypothetical protein